jgi:CzcA family heavy metal efflux pump
MRALVATCLAQRWVVLGLAVLFVLLGSQVASDAAFDAFPEFAPPRVEIQTEAPGLSSEEVEALVTTPLEAALGGTPGLAQMRSRSVLGLSSVVLLFAPGSDLMEARNLVQERIARVGPSLPAVSRAPVMLSPLSSTSRILKVGLWSAELSQMELTDLARWVVRPRLMSIPGVANVAIWGERDRQLQVRVDPDRLAAHGVGLDRVIAASRDAVAPRAGGFVDGPAQRLPVIHAPLASTAGELAAVPLAFAPGRTLTLGDVADVVEDHPAAIGDAVVTGGVGILLIVEKHPEGNTLEVTRRVDEALAALAPALPGVDVDATIFRPAGFIERALANLGEAMAIGCALVILVLFVFLWDWRTALVSVVAIPLSLLAAAVVLTGLGRTIDTMVIAGLVIALGEVVDDAIIDVENIHRRLGLAQVQAEAAGTGPLGAARTLAIVLEASLEVRSAIVYASLIVILVFVPILFLEGVAGEFFRPLALAYGLAVLASTVVALTVTPALALVLLPRGANERPSPVARVLTRRYAPILAAALARPRAVLAATALALVAALASSVGLREEFLPAFQENDFLMHWIARPGTSLEAVVRTADLARGELLSVPGVRNFGSHIGRAEVADEVVGPNFAELWVSVDPEADLPATLARVRAVVDGYPGVYRDVQTYLQERMREVLSGGSGAIVVRIYGADLPALRERAGTLAASIETVDGVAHARPEGQVLVPQIEIAPDLDRCAALGIDPGLVRARASTLVQGERVGQVVRGQQPLDVVVWGAEAVRDDVAALRDLAIQLDDRRMVRLGDVASVRIAPMQNTIAHDAGSRKIDVIVDLAPGADLGAVGSAIDAQVAVLALPPGHHAEVLGEHEARARARGRLGFASLFALIGIGLVLLADFRSARLAGLVLASLPFALVGGILAAILGGGVVSLGTLVGLVTVIGIAARNGIMMVAHFRHLEEHEAVPFGPELVVRGATERLAPVLMTALATGLALLPLVVRGSAPGHEIEHPMAIVILGGLASSTVLNLVVMPVLYLRYGRRSAAERA